MNTKNIFLLCLPNPKKMLTDPHRGLGTPFQGYSTTEKLAKTSDRYQKVSVSEHSIITVYIYFVIFEAVKRYGER